LETSQGAPSLYVDFDRSPARMSLTVNRELLHNSVEGKKQNKTKKKHPTLRSEISM